MPTRTYVLVHGAWHGGWCWRGVADRLAAGGHRVTTPTHTGLGERAHLMSAEITLETFVTDLVNHLEFEELTDVILVGHSFGGCSISGAADRVGGRIRKLVYLDSMMVEGGARPFDLVPPEVAASRRAEAERTSGGVSMPAPPPEAMGVTAPEQLALLRAKMTPHPIGSYESPLALDGPVGAGLPCEYIICTEPVYPPFGRSRDWVRERGWPIRELATGHDAMISAPGALADLLLDA